MKKFFVFLVLIFASLSLMVSGCGKVAQETSESFGNDQNIEAASLSSKVQIPDNLKNELFPNSAIKLPDGLKGTQIINVPSDYPTIQEAINKAKEKFLAIIQIAEGEYADGNDISIKRHDIWLVGAGRDKTKVLRPIYVSTGYKNIKVLKLQSDYIGADGGNSIEVKSCTIKNTLYVGSGGYADISYNVIVGSLGTFFTDSKINFIHNTVDNTSYGIYYKLFDLNTYGDGTVGGLLIIHDNIFTNSYHGIAISTEASSRNFVSIQNNDLWNNRNNYDGVEPGENDIFVDPLYIGNGDYGLQEGSPCRGTASDGKNIGAIQN